MMSTKYDIFQFSNNVVRFSLFESIINNNNNNNQKKKKSEVLKFLVSSKIVAFP